MAQILDTVLLLALPASGKSEVRKYLRHLDPAEAARDFHMGPSVQLDDFPYVHMMRRVDDELEARGKPRGFFIAADRSFRDPRHWGTLIALVSEDYEDLVVKRAFSPASAAAHLLERIEAASAKVGARSGLADVDAEAREAVTEALEAEAREMLDEKLAGYPDTLEGKTVVIEFARGGPDGSDMPLEAPYGYAYSLACLSPAILEKAVILYVWVTPEESRRKNEARADPNDPGSILHHSVPLAVMLGEYGCDDMDWLERHAQVQGTISVHGHDRTYHIPIGRFDNRVDRTSFLRDDASDWSPEDVRLVHEGLRSALQKVASLRKS